MITSVYELRATSYEKAPYHILHRSFIRKLVARSLSLVAVII